MISDGNMPDDADLSANHDAASYFGGPRNTGLGGNGRIFTDDDIMRNLNKIINFHVPLNPGFTHGGPVNGGVGAQFHVIVNLNDADLGNFGIARAGRGKAEAVRADDDAGMKNHTLADDAVLINADIGVKDRIFADGSVAADKHAGIDDSAFFDAGRRD